MKPYIKVLGKVCVTVNGDWDKELEYERLCIVKNATNKKVYISICFVPKDTEITNTEYWQYLYGGIEDNLNSSDAEQALSANMGRMLKELITSTADNLSNSILNLIVKHNDDIFDIHEDIATNVNNINKTIAENVATINNTISRVSKQHEDDIDNLTSTINNISAQHAADIAEVQQLVSNITSFEAEVVTTLPTTGTKGVIYLVKSTGTTTDKATYTEYIWIPSTSSYEILGEFETAVDLDSYQAKLVSGSNIKTINGVSILGSGNINTTPNNATTNASGLMSSTDKQKLDGIQSGATVVSFSRAYTSGTKIGTITINGVATDIYIPIWNGTIAQYNAIANKQSDMIYNITD